MCFVFTYLRTNSDLYNLQHKLIGFYNRDEKCLQRGTDWVFKYSGLRFVFKSLIHPTIPLFSLKAIAVFHIFRVRNLLRSLHLNPSLSQA
jgi:hypothetical protein